jgi:serine protease
VGGYLGITHSGTDIGDVYIVQMAAGQSATLLLADPARNDFDLFLFDDSGNVLDSSEGVEKAERITAPGNGTFLVEVFGYSVAFEGDSGGLYTLLVGENPLGDSAIIRASEHLSSLYEFVPGEVLVKKRGGPAVRADGSVAIDGLRAETIDSGENAFGYARLRVEASGTVRRAAGGALRRPASETITAIKKLRRLADIERAEPNYIRRTAATPNDEFFELQWHYLQINLPQAWDITTGSPEVIVAVIDTGIVLDHPDMQGQLTAGFDFIADPFTARDGDGIDPDPNDPGDLEIGGTSSTFHGTHVGGTVAARTNDESGVAGVAWDARLMPIRVLGRGGGTDIDIVQGMRFAAGLSNDSGTVPEQSADIINMSLGGPGFSALAQEAVNAARDAGVIVIAAAGNEASNADGFTPAGLEGVVTVSAVDFSRALAGYSNFGSSVEVAAPGGDVTADVNGDSFVDGVLSSVGQDDGGFAWSFYDGTSMAAPHIAGVAALMKAVNPDMTPADFDLLLAGTHPGTDIQMTDDLGPPGRDDSFGFGLINALNALRAVAEIAGVTAIDTPLIQVVPADLDFGTAGTSADITVANAGAQTLSVTSVTTTDDWIAVTPIEGGEGTYTVTVDRNGLSDGVFSGSVNFVSNGGEAAVAVRMSVGEFLGEGGNIGTIYLLLLDRDSFETIAQFEATAADDYAFDFADVAPGDYLLFGGTDMDDDGLIDNEGEAFGSYPTLLDPAVLEVTEDRPDLSFAVTYSINLQVPSSAGSDQADPLPRARLKGLSIRRVR